MDVKDLTADIVAEFRNELGDSVVLDQNQQDLVARAADRVARAYVDQLVRGSDDPALLAEFRFIMDSSTAVLGNIKLANEINADTAFRGAVERALKRVLDYGFALLRMYVGGLTGLPVVVPLAPQTENA